MPVLSGDVIKKEPRTHVRRPRRAKELFEQYGFDPIEELVQVVRGNHLASDHPFLTNLLVYVSHIRDLSCEEPTPATHREIRKLCDQLVQKGTEALQETYIRPEIKIKTLTELARYAHPTMKAVDVNLHTSDVEGAATPLTVDDVMLVDTWFEENF